MAKSVTSQLIMELLDRVTGPSRRVMAAMRGVNGAVKDSSGVQVSMSDRLASSQLRAQAAYDRTRGAVLDSVAAYYTLSAAIGAPVRSAMKFESAMADVKKVVDFTDDVDLKGFEMGLLDMSKRIPVAVDGLAAIAAAAGQAGIAKGDILAFTEAAAKLGVAFDISADEAGLATAKLMTGLGLTLPEVLSLTDAMNHLSNAQASSAAEVLDVVRRVGALGKQYGFAAEDVAAFGSAMVASGAQSDVAATSFVNMGRALTRGASATKRQRAAYKTLGMDAEKVSKSMQENAVATTASVLEAIAKLPAEMQAAVSSDLFGDEARALGPLLTNLSLLRQSLGLVADESAYAGSVTKEFAARSATFQNRMQLFNNSLERLKVTIGNALLPALTALMDNIEPIIDRIAEWTAAHPDLTGNIMATVGAAVALKGALAVLRAVGLTGLVGRAGSLALAAAGFRSLAVEAALAGAAVETAGRKAKSGRAAMLAAVARAVPWAATAALSGDTPAKSPEEQASFTESKDRLSKIADLDSAEAVLAAAAKIPELRAKQDELLAKIEAQGAEFSDGYDAASADLSRQLAEVQAELDRAEGQAGELSTALAAVGMADVSPNVDSAAIDRALTKTKQLRGELLRINAAGGNANAGEPIKGARAKGGPVSRGGVYLVGEDGPEVMTASKSGYVHPNGTGVNGGGSGGGSGSGGKGGVQIGAVHMTVAPSLSFPNATMADAEAIAKTVTQKIEERLGAMFRGNYADVWVGD